MRAPRRLIPRAEPTEEWPTAQRAGPIPGGTPRTSGPPSRRPPPPARTARVLRLAAARGLGQRIVGVLHAQGQTRGMPQPRCHQTRQRSAPLKLPENRQFDRIQRPGPRRPEHRAKPAGDARQHGHGRIRNKGTQTPSPDMGQRRPHLHSRASRPTEPPHKWLKSVAPNTNGAMVQGTWGERR